MNINEEISRKRYIRKQYGVNWNIQNCKEKYNKVHKPPTTIGYIGQIYGVEDDIDYYKKQRNINIKKLNFKLSTQREVVKIEGLSNILMS